MKITNNLGKFLSDDVQRKGYRAVTKALIVGAAEASVKTPIDTSTLLNSQYRNVLAIGGTILGKVGYTAEYADYVHDPRVVQIFRRSTAEKEFLKRGFEENLSRIEDVIRKEMKA